MDGFNDQQKMIAELLKVKMELVSLMARHTLAVNTQDMIMKIDKILGNQK